MRQIRYEQKKCRGKLCFPSFGSLVLGLCLTLSFTGCIAELQSARTVDKGKYEVTPYLSAYTGLGDHNSRETNTIKGLQIAVGVNDASDFRFRYAQVGTENGRNANFISFGPKFGIISGSLALAVPFAFIFGENLSEAASLQIHPTLIASVMSNEFIELNTSVKALVWLPSPGNPAVSLNFGPAISRNLEIWAVRPEVGYIFSPGEDGLVIHYSLGFTYYW